MLRIVLITTRPDDLPAFIEALSENSQVHLNQAPSGAEVLATVRSVSPHLVVIDQSLPDVQPLQLVPQLLAVDAMVNTAVLSPLAAAEFHEASEGLGILTRLPLNPGRDEALELLHKLRSVVGQAA